MSVQRPESRYGRQARSPRSRRRIAIALGVLALAAGVTVAVIGYQRLGTAEVSGQLNGYHLVDDQTVAKTNGGSTRSVAGICRGVDSDGVWVEF